MHGKEIKKLPHYSQKMVLLLHTFKDQVIFEENEVLKADGKPYTVFTPYKNKWLSHFSKEMLPSEASDFKALYKKTQVVPCFE